MVGSMQKVAQTVLQNSGLLRENSELDVKLQELNTELERQVSTVWHKALHCRRSKLVMSFACTLGLTPHLTSKHHISSEFGHWQTNCPPPESLQQWIDCNHHSCIILTHFDLAELRTLKAPLQHEEDNLHALGEQAEAREEEEEEAAREAKEQEDRAKREAAQSRMRAAHSRSVSVPPKLQRPLSAETGIPPIEVWLSCKCCLSNPKWKQAMGLVHPLLE